MPSQDAETPKWQYNGGQGQEMEETDDQPEFDPVNWTGDEFVYHQKSARWFMQFAAFAAVLAALAYLISKEFVPMGVVILVSIVFGVLAVRKPRKLAYTIDDQGVQIGERRYPFEQFKSFSINASDGAHAIWLMPLKRFMPILTIYFDPMDEERVANTLALVLPFEQREPDAIDRLMHSIHF